MEEHLKFLFLAVLACFVTSKNATDTTFDETKLLLDGDIVFGGLFPMHEKGKSGTNCGKIKKEKGIQRLEAMLFAIERINEDPDLLPGVKVGAHILDTCSFDTYALEQCMDFIKAQMTTIDLADYKCEDGHTPKYLRVKPVAGVIGAASSPVSIMVANILRLFKKNQLKRLGGVNPDDHTKKAMASNILMTYRDDIDITIVDVLHALIRYSGKYIGKEGKTKIPQISYASTSIDLSDKSRFEYFSRVVPPDSFQAQAMVDIAREFGWNYVSTLADDGNYGDKGIGAFEERAKGSGVCVAQSLKISRVATDEEYTHLVNELLSVPKARAVVMFVNEDNCRNLLSTLQRMNKTNQLTFLASDSWGAKNHPVYGQETVAEGTVTILPKRGAIQEFDVYFRNRTLSNTENNPWFKEYWEAMYGCSFEMGADIPCTGDEKQNVNYKQEGLVQFVIDSVYALAHAIHSLLTDHCSSDFNTCLQGGQIPGEQVLGYIRNVSFTGIGGDPVRFNKKGDGFGKYDIFQYQRLGRNTFQYINIGEWTNNLTIDRASLRFRDQSPVIPESVCSQPCQFGYAKNNTVESDTCCWVCIKCGENQYLKDEFTCKDCPDGFKPSKNITGCVPLPVLHLNLASLWFLIPVTFSTLGIIASCFVLYVFVKYNNTPVIMASGRELCYVLLVGIILSYGTSFVLLAKPSVVLCTVKRFLLGISLCLIYAAMLTKTNRLYRIFNRGIKAMVKRPGYTSPKSQIFICFCLVSVQIVGGLTWLGFEKPETQYEKQYRDYLVLKCKASQIAMLLSLVYNILLIVLCTVFGFKTRKIPQNFNEAKYIAFTMYSTCIVWLAFVPIYFGANHDFKIEITSLCMCVSISASVALVCIFGPKVYIVIFQPHKNVRQGATPSLQTGSRHFPKPYLPSHSTLNSHDNQNGSLKNVQVNATQETMIHNDLFSDSMEEDEDEFCDEGTFIPKPTEDKAVSTSDT